VNSRAAPKLKLLSHLAEVAKALAHPVRLELREALGQGERNVESPAQACGQPVANTSHHLQVRLDRRSARCRGRQ
jgi:DNA-binding transcriptional ArsR family regulator